MSATTANVRFMANNFLGDDIVVTATSESAGFPVENVYGDNRNKTWRSSGYFAITTSNCNLYFNDGSARTAAIPVGAYTPSTLATAIAAAAVTAGATATVVASAYSTAPYVWKLVFNTSVTLSLSSTSNAIWDTLGFVGSTDRTGTTFVADAPRAHTYEQVTFNLGVARSPTFFAACGPIDQVFRITSAATVTLMFSNTDSWTSPPVTVTLTRTDAGLKEFLDSNANVEYEYVAIRIVDRENPYGLTGVELGPCYLGDHETVTTTNVNIGWTKSYVDLSTRAKTDSGVIYSRQRPRYRTFSGMGMGNVDPDERRDLEQLFYDVGLAGKLWVAFDPMLEVSEDVDELTAYVVLKDDAKFSHVIRDLYSIAVDFEEVV